MIDVQFSENVADPLTKGLKKELVEKTSLEWVSSQGLFGCRNWP